MTQTQPFRVLFVCTGNICRSPTAEGVARAQAARTGRSGSFEFDSAGITDWHVGKPPDQRAQAAAKRRGVNLSGQRARQVAADDFHRFDLIVAMDDGHFAALSEMLGAKSEIPARAEIRRMLDFSPGAPTRDVPDPFYGGEADYELVLDLLEPAIEAMLAAYPPPR